ncbi:uncharacterized protein LOC120158777 [Hibiscus syriacus]|uniref:uncharacterized protein LOC120158777 n=1 Tax=Hibiscus syriacus TaxID=106335 RepID=UPI001924B2FF|nr:uncharacterized protein LOC120158777 [Hibiscus syriacus]
MAAQINDCTVERRVSIREKGVNSKVKAVDDSPTYRQYVHQFIVMYNPSLVALLETRASGHRSEDVIWMLGFSNSFRIEAHEFSGGIWLLWKLGTIVEHLWDHLKVLDPGGNHPWVLGGDFNSLLNQGERVESSAGRIMPSTGFNGFLDDTVMMELGFHGPLFTWSRGSLHQRLDRYLGFNDLLKNTWINDRDIQSNLADLQMVLTDWNQAIFGKIGKRKRRLMACLRGCDNTLMQMESSYLLELEIRLRNELESVLEHEDSLWQQKARCKWTMDGDRNTRLYHACAKNHRRKNNILSLKHADGNW